MLASHAMHRNHRSRLGRFRGVGTMNPIRFLPWTSQRRLACATSGRVAALVFARGLPSMRSARAWRSWIWGGAALLFGLALYAYDDWSETVQHPPARILLEIVELLVMGPGMAALAFFLSEWMREQERRHRQALARERERWLVGAGGMCGGGCRLIASRIRPMRAGSIPNGR